MTELVEMENKIIYCNLCSDNTDMPVFFQPWWLDIVCGDNENWDVALVKKSGDVIAVHPYYIKRKFGFVRLLQPPLTQFLGPFFITPIQGKYGKILSRQNKVMAMLYEQLPRFDQYQQNWSPQITNWLYWYWKGFEQTTRYTYVLKNIESETDIWSGFHENIRREIRKARSRYHLKIIETQNIDEFIELNRKTFERQNLSIPYNESVIRRLDSACVEHKCRKIFTAVDEKGILYAAVYIVWDQQSAYYLMGGSVSELRNSGAMSLCLWEAILFCSNVTQSFNFEGSMIKSIEYYFRSFGTEQIPYSMVKKIPSKILNIRQFVHNLIL